MQLHPDQIPITIGGKDRFLRFTLAAFVAAQVRYKVRVTLSMLADPSLADVPILVWIGLLTDLPRLSLETVVGWVEAGEVDVAGFLTQAVPPILRLLGMAPGDVAEQADADEEAPGVLDLSPLE